MEIYLIRHGKTSANEQRLYCGATDLPLSEAGIAELMELNGSGIYPERVDSFFTSGLIRTEQTLDILYGSVYRRTFPQLKEYSFGLFEMKSYETLKDMEAYQAWITDDTGLISCPDGDNKQGFTRRILEGYRLLLENTITQISPDTESNSASTLLVSHGGVITGIMEHLFPNKKNFYEWQPKPGRGYTLIYDSIELIQYKQI